MNEINKNEDVEQRYHRMVEESDKYFDERIKQVSSRAYEYGVLVVKNAFLVAGGGLFITPAMVQLVAEPNLGQASVAGVCFAAAVLLTLVANYIIHINWTLHEELWQKYHDRDRILIRKSLERTFETDEAELTKLSERAETLNCWIQRTFFAPHVLAWAYIVLFIVACFKLYQSLGVVW